MKTKTKLVPKGLLPDNTGCKHEVLSDFGFMELNRKVGRYCQNCRCYVFQETDRTGNPTGTTYVSRYVRDSQI